MSRDYEIGSRYGEDNHERGEVAELWNTMQFSHVVTTFQWTLRRGKSEMLGRFIYYMYRMDGKGDKSNRKSVYAFLLSVKGNRLRSIYNEDSAIYFRIGDRMILQLFRNSNEKMIF